MLTGDKIETAIQIGFSTGLLNEAIAQHIVDGILFKDISQQLIAAADYVYN